MKFHRSGHAASRSLPAAAKLQFEPLEPRQVLSGVPELLFDVNPISFSKDSIVSSITEMNGVAYFVMGATGAHAIWKTDGTAEGTAKVRDFVSVESLTNVNGTLYFSASDAFEDKELWRSDGTYAGTFEVEEKRRTWYGSDPNNLLNVNGAIYFTAYDSTSGIELWRSDGTAAGTQLVKDIYPGINSSSATPKAAAGDLLVFAANDGVTGRELWRSDGTEAGTFMIKDIAAGNVSSNLTNFVELNNVLYFSAESDQGDRQLWRTDGTASGTWLVKDINPNGNDQTQSLINVGDVLYFMANDGVTGAELWKSDGTEQGTLLVADIAPYGSSLPSLLVNMSGQLMFSANDGYSGQALWTSDGTSEGTIRLAANLFDNVFLGQPSPNPLVNVDGIVYFHAANSAVGRELWRSDGTSQGTRLVKNIWQGSGSSSPAFLTPLGDQLLFMANDGAHGIEPWISDGSESGTTLVKDVSQGTMSSDPTTPVNVNGVHYFAANDGEHGVELWRTDGTATGTHIVKDVRPGALGSAPRYLTNVNGALYFVANDGAHGFEVWRSDGTPEGTVLLKDVDAQPSSSNPSYLTNVNGILYFSAFNGVSRLEPWRSDGTSEGTVVIDVNPTGSSTPSDFVAFNGDTYFLAYSPSGHGKEVWRIAGDAPPARLRDSKRYLNSVEQLLLVGNHLFFTRSANELWITDGTETGTRLVKKLSLRLNGASPWLTECNGILYFVATTSEHGAELWRSNGTESGTYLVRDVRIGLAGSEPRHLINVNGTLFFTSNDGTHGVELWKSDGTTDGTQLAHDFIVGVAHSYPFGQGQQPIACIIGDWLYLVTTPTSLGTVPSISRVNRLTGKVELVTDARLGTGNYAYPQWLFNLNGELGLSAAMFDTVSYGAELRVLRDPTRQSAGDYSGDGVIDGADFLAWQRAYASHASAPGHGADGSGNGLVNGNDLEVWKDHFGETTAAPPTLLVAAIVAPEPTPPAEPSIAELDAAFEVTANEPSLPGAPAIALRAASSVEDAPRPHSERAIDPSLVLVHEHGPHRHTSTEPATLTKRFASLTSGVKPPPRPSSQAIAPEDLARAIDALLQ